MEALETRRLLDGSPIISEFMASNSNTLLDEYGLSSDWVEVTNNGDMQIDLSGYHLTDNAGDLTRWTFPSTVLQPGEQLVVFASGADQAISGQQLHTNFGLNPGGEYLALVAPDGQTLLSEFGAEGTNFPLQFRDVSYGVDQQITTLLGSGDAARVLVPTDDSLGTTWTGGGAFVDASWTDGTLGVGFDTESSSLQLEAADANLSNLIGYWDFDNDVQDTSGNGQHGSVTGTQQYSTNVPTQIGAGSSFSFNGASRVDLPFMGFYDKAHSTGATLSMWVNAAPQNDKRIFAEACNSPGGCQPFYGLGSGGGGSQDSPRLFIRNTTGTATHLVVGSTIPFDSSWHHVLWTDNGGSTALYIDGVKDMANFDYSPLALSANNTTIGGWNIGGTLGSPLTGLVDDVAMWDAVLSTSSILELVSGVSPRGVGASYGDLINTDLETAMFTPGRTSAYLRIPFEVPDPAALQTLTLRLRYDDGAVIYLNGTEVARRNAPAALTFDATAATERNKFDALTSEEIGLTQHVGRLQPGTNILAIYGLNVSGDDGDFLILPELVTTTTAGLGQGYFIQPTPGQANGNGIVLAGPIISEVTELSSQPQDGEDLVITARVAPDRAPVNAVTLYYRTMFEPEMNLAMVDNGSVVGDVPGDGIFTAIIPASASDPGEMLRWYVIASDTTANLRRAPLYVSPGLYGGPEYFGTVIADPAIDTQLPVLQWFVEDPQWYDPSGVGQYTKEHTHASLIYNGQFFDNVRTRLRGASTFFLQFPKQSLKFQFNPGHDFTYSPQQPAVTEINVNAPWVDKSLVRNMLSMEVYRDAGAPYSESFMMAVYENGVFHSVANFVEQPDEDSIQRNGLPPNGSLYKIYNGLRNAAPRPVNPNVHPGGLAGVEKKTRQYEDNSDLQAFIDGINGAGFVNFLFDNANIPEMINYMAAGIIIRDWDSLSRNHFMYRDTEGNGEWSILPWDRDNGWGYESWRSDTITASTPTGLSHPLYGQGSFHPLNDAILDSPVLREMYLCRLRTVLDTILQPPETPISQLKLTARFEELFDQMNVEVDVDKGMYGNPYGTQQNFRTTLDAIKSYLSSRRTHLYVTHGPDGSKLIPPAQSGDEIVDFTTLIDESAQATVIVPTTALDAIIGDTWTGLPANEPFDDSPGAGWTTGNVGIGYERSSGYENLINLDLLPLIDLNSDGTNENDSIYVRIPFTVGDPSAFHSLHLQMKYDDGVVVYLNGQRMLGSNAPDAASLDWNSSATDSRSDVKNTTFQQFNLDAHLGALIPNATNILAIHGLNVGFDAQSFSPGIAAAVGAADPNDLIGYWDFDNDLRDTSGNGQHGTFMGTEQYSTDIPAQIGDGSSFSFDGGSRVDLPFMGFYDKARSTGATLSMWVKAPPQNDNRIFAEACNSGGCRSFYGLGSDNTGSVDNPRLFIRSDNNAFTHDTSGATTMFDSTWHHIVLTDNAGSATVYIDGVQDPTVFDYNPTSRVTPDNTTIGGWNIGGGPGSLLTGLIDDVAIWDTVLPTSSILELAIGISPPSVGSPQPSVETVAYWRMEDSPAPDQSTNSDAISDSSGSGNPLWFWDGGNGTDTNNNEYHSSNDTPPAIMTTNVPGSNNLSFDPSAMSASADGGLFFDRAQQDDNFAFSEDFTLEGYFKTDGDQSGAGRMEIIQQAGADNTYWVSLNQAAADGSLRFELKNSSGPNASVTLSGRNYADGQWHYFAARYDNRGAGVADELLLVVMDEDGIAVRNTALSDFSFALATTSNDMLIGRKLDSPAEAHFLGKLDEIRISSGLVEDQNLLAAVFLVGTSSDMLVLPVLEAGFTTPGSTNFPQIDFGTIEFNPSSGNQDEEYIELVNPNNVAVDISGWRLEGGVSMTFQPGTVIPNGGTLYLSPDVRAFRARATSPTGGEGRFVQGYAGHISNFGETINLLATDATQIDSVATPVTPSDAQRYLRVSELHYNPLGVDDTEFIELTNISSGAEATTLDLSGAAISDGPSAPFVLPVGTMLAPGDFLLVVKNKTTFQAAYPTVDPAIIFGNFQGSLSNAGENVKLDDPQGSTILDFNYGDNDPWPVRADGNGASLQLIDPAGTPTDQYAKYYRWRGSTEFGGSPGESGSVPSGVVINEVLAHTDPPVVQSDSIELHNPTGVEIDIGGWYLSDSSANYLKYEIAPGTMLPASGNIVFNESHFNPNPGSPATTDFALSGANGDDVWLTIPDGSGGILSFVDDLHFGASPNGESFGRVPNGSGRLAPIQSTTLGSANVTPRVGPLVLSELNYNPGLPSSSALAIDPTLSKNDLEFIEILNPSSTTVVLTDWRIRGGVDYDFTAGTTIGAGEVLVIVSLDPLSAIDTRPVDAFRAHYGLGSDVMLVGPYQNQLSNSFDRIELQRPDSPPPESPLTIPRLLEDEVLYDDRTPWDTAADGTGFSLHRTPPGHLGNDPQFWTAATPRPGQRDRLGDTDLDGDVDTGDLTTAIINFTSAGGVGKTWSLGDTDGDGDVDTGDLTTAIIGFTGARTYSAASSFSMAVSIQGTSGQGSDLMINQMEPGSTDSPLARLISTHREIRFSSSAFLEMASRLFSSTGRRHSKTMLTDVTLENTSDWL